MQYSAELKAKQMLTTVFVWVYGAAEVVIIISDKFIPTASGVVCKKNLNLNSLLNQPNRLLITNQLHMSQYMGLCTIHTLTRGVGATSFQK